MAWLLEAGESDGRKDQRFLMLRFSKMLRVQFDRVEDASASQARCTCYGRDTETREAHVSEKHNEVHNCCHGDSTVALGIIATQEYK